MTCRVRGKKYHFRKRWGGINIVSHQNIDPCIAYGVVEGKTFFAFSQGLCRQHSSCITGRKKKPCRMDSKQGSVKYLPEPIMSC
jgi:hypothetical protein